MAQLTIYLDDDSFHRIVAAAARENTSVSGWAKKILLQALTEQWPVGYFKLFGALGHADLQRSQHLDFSVDGPRDTL